MIEEERIKPSSRIREILLRRSALFAITTLSFGACILLIAFGLFAKPTTGTNQQIKVPQRAPIVRKLARCEEDYGVQVYPHPGSCNQFYKCTNGSLTIETCENGLLFDGKTFIHNYCNYLWAVNCGDRLADDTKLSSPGCEYQFGIFPISSTCDTTFVKCAYGEVEPNTCEKGLAYDDRVHACNWPDLIPGCDASSIVGFQCPTDISQIEEGDIAREYWPFPRFASNDCYSLITCVNYSPRLIKCEEGKAVNQFTRKCENIEYVHGCNRK